MREYLSELENCTLCEWECRVDRLNGEKGVCRLEVPEIASAMLHPAPPQSYTIFMRGCNLRCLNCQNWSIAHSSDNIRGLIEPKELAREAVERLNSSQGKYMGADRIFFSGGEPTLNLPYIEKVVKEARKIESVKVNYDTNGFMTIDSLNRILDFTTSITFDIKAFSDEIHRSLTGAPVGSVLRNAEYIAKNAKDKLWEFRYLLIPKINESDVKELAEFLLDIDEDLPLNFLAFRPNYIMEKYPGATKRDMEKAVDIAKSVGLTNVSWDGFTGLPGEPHIKESEEYSLRGAKIAGGIAEDYGCIFHPRDCGKCTCRNNCSIKAYKATRRT